MKWWHSDSPRTKKFRLALSADKAVLTLFRDMKCAASKYCMEKWITVNATSCCNLMSFYFKPTIRAKLSNCFRMELASQHTLLPLTEQQQLFIKLKKWHFKSHHIIFTHPVLFWVISICSGQQKQQREDGTSKRKRKVKLMV
jgi:hypothetical protein